MFRHFSFFFFFNLSKFMSAKRKPPDYKSATKKSIINQCLSLGRPTPIEFRLKSLHFVRVPHPPKSTYTSGSKNVKFFFVETFQFHGNIKIICFLENLSLILLKIIKTPNLNQPISTNHFLGKVVKKGMSLDAV